MLLTVSQKALYFFIPPVGLGPPLFDGHPTLPFNTILFRSYFVCLRNLKVKLGYVKQLQKTLKYVIFLLKRSK